MSLKVTCECRHSPSVFDLETYPNDLLSHVELVDRTAWLTLQRCVVCEQLWQLDNVDRLQTNLAIKFDANVAWNEFDDKTSRFKYLIDSRGGVSEDTCVMEGCQHKALKTLAHCPNHAFNYIGLRE